MRRHSDELVFTNLKHLSDRLMDEGHTVKSAIDFLMKTEYAHPDKGYQVNAHLVSDEIIYHFIDTPNRPPDLHREKQFAIIRGFCERIR